MKKLPPGIALDNHPIMDRLARNIAALPEDRRDMIMDILKNEDTEALQTDLDAQQGLNHEKGNQG